MMNTVQLPETKDILLDRQGSVLHLWLNRPDIRNALADTLLEEFTQTLDVIAEDRTIRTLVVRGKNQMFCAGGNIKGFKNNLQASQDSNLVAQSNRTYGTFLEKLNRQPQVVIMVVEGGAIGGGLGLACVGDVTIIEATTKFRLSETSLGIPPAQIAPFVVQRLGLTQARRIMLTGAAFKGEEAVRLGIGHFLVHGNDGIDSCLQTTLNQIDNCAPMATALTKNIALRAATEPLSDALDKASNDFAQCMLSEEGREGIAAFLEKRSAKWVETN